MRLIQKRVRENTEIALDERLAKRFCAVAERAAKRLRPGAAERLKPNDILERTGAGVKAAQVVGVISTPGATLEILPKIDGPNESVRQSLLRMLCVAWNLRVADGELASLGSQRSDLLELLVGLFASRLLAAVRGGLPRRYMSREEDLGLMRGRLHVVRQITALAARPDVLACRFDELSEDTPLNRVLKAAVVRLAKVVRTAANARLLAELSARLEGVGLSSTPLEEPVRLDRTNTAYHDLHQLARLFLSGDWQSTAGGQSLGFSLLFPMHDLFERFIGRCLCRALMPWRVSLQDTMHNAVWDDERKKKLFELRPDAVIDTPNGPVVLDTKWKKLDPNKEQLDVHRDDVYQMLAYGRAYKAKRLVLLYPWLEGVKKGVARSWRVVGTGLLMHGNPFVMHNPQRLDIATVDVGEPRNVACALRKIVGMG